MSATASMPIDATATLAILAGGEGRRMGQPKAWMTLAGQPILERLIDRLAWQGPTLLVTTPGRTNPPGTARFDREVIDEQPDQGPLRGVLTALEAAATEFLIVLPADMPQVTAEPLRWLLQRLADDERCILAMMQRYLDEALRLEPLPVAMRVGAARDEVRRQMAGGDLSLRSLARSGGARLHPYPRDWTHEFWTNLNRPGDREAFEAGLASSRTASAPPTSATRSS